MRPTASVLLLALLASGTAFAEGSGNHDPANHGKSRSDHQPSPYSGMETRAVKALSDEQIADLAEGRGMGLALVAELNYYPGPVHVLELAGALDLTPDQRSQTKDLLDGMKADTIPIGRRIIALERDLDQLFAGMKITVEALRKMTAQIGAAQGELRAAHLRYHLEMAEVLSTDQIERYAELRGYAAVAR
jgi:hypothetical protein